MGFAFQSKQQLCLESKCRTAFSGWMDLGHDLSPRQWSVVTLLTAAGGTTAFAWYATGMAGHNLHLAGRTSGGTFGISIRTFILYAV